LSLIKINNLQKKREYAFYFILLFDLLTLKDIKTLMSLYQNIDPGLKLTFHAKIRLQPKNEKKKKHLMTL